MYTCQVLVVTSWGTLRTLIMYLIMYQKDHYLSKLVVVFGSFQVFGHVPKVQLKG
jgi:hypothetical protein